MSSQYTRLGIYLLGGKPMLHRSSRVSSKRSPRTLAAIGLINVCLSMSALAGPGPVIHEDGWLVEASIPFTNPMSAIINPSDGMIYLGRRAGDLYRTDYAGNHEMLVNTTDIAGLAYDPITEAMFLSEDFPGRIQRVDIDTKGTATAQQWVTGFHSGDDDPTGITIVPLDYTGDVFTPGTMASVDRGYNGPKEVWSWTPEIAEGETLIHDNGGVLSDPVDIAINNDTVMIADSTGILRTLQSDGSLSTFTTSGATFSNIQSLVFDTRTDDLLVLDIDLDSIYRVNTKTGIATLVIDQLGTGVTNWGGLNIHDDGTTQFLLVSSIETDLVNIFSNTPPCSGADLAGPFGELDFFDVSEFLDAFAAHDPAVDYTKDGRYDFFDVSAFLDLFSAGCP